jgi:hypothetical protein
VRLSCSDHLRRRQPLTAADPAEELLLLLLGQLDEEMARGVRDLPAGDGVGD